VRKTADYYISLRQLYRCICMFTL